MNLNNFFKKHIAKVVTILVLILVVIFFIIYNTKVSGLTAAPIIAQSVTTSAPTVPTPPPFVFTTTLKLGMTIPDVQNLQKFLNANSYVIAKSGPGSLNNETTKFGNLTKLALIKFQKANELQPDGIFGPMTMKVVNAKLAINPLPVTNTLGTYSIGGTITGYEGTVTLQNNGGDTLTVNTVPGATNFTFPTTLTNNSKYNITVAANTFQQCSATNNIGTVNNTNVTDVQITCKIHGGGTVSSAATTPVAPVIYATAPSDMELTYPGLCPSSSIFLCSPRLFLGETPVGGVNNVGIPDPGKTDTTGAVNGWRADTANQIRFNVADVGSATSTITINGTTYTNGDDYTITSEDPLTIVVTTTETGKTTAVRTFRIKINPAIDYATVPDDIELSLPGACMIEGCESYPVGGVTNVGIPDPGEIDTSGAVTGWVADTADMIKFTVSDAGDAVSTITIDGTPYTSGHVYTITSTDPLTIVVNTTETGKVTAVRTFNITVAPKQTDTGQITG